MSARPTLILLAVSGFMSASVELSAQQRVDSRNLNERIMVIVPMVGSGTAADPRRPLFTPNFGAKGVASSLGRSAILGFSYQVSDDGRFALLELVALERTAFQPLFADTANNLKIFEKGKHSRAEIETEFRKYKADFDLAKFGGAR